MMADQQGSRPRPSSSWAPQGRPSRRCHRQHYNRVRLLMPKGISESDSESIIAIHGLDTESPRTWEYNSGSRVVNWLADSDMLPTDFPEARIFTYDWNANSFENAPVQTLLGHADTLLGLIAESRGSNLRPIIFIASCFGGLILAEVCKLDGRGKEAAADILRQLIEPLKKAAATGRFYFLQRELCSLAPHFVAAMPSSRLSGRWPWAASWGSRHRSSL